MKSCYLAGPMRNYPSFNFPAFRRAAELLRAQGWDVTSPVEMDEQDGFDATGLKGTDEELAELGFSLHHALQRDFAAILEVDAVVFLPGWERSSGANAEKFVAEKIGRELYTFNPDTEILSPLASGPIGDPRFHALLQRIGDLHDRKQQDYGRDADPFANVRGAAEWGVEPWVGALIRATDKIRRLQKVARGGELANETAEDSFLDLAVYALIGLVLFQEESA